MTASARRPICFVSDCLSHAEPILFVKMTFLPCDLPTNLFRILIQTRIKWGTPFRTTNIEHTLSVRIVVVMVFVTELQENERCKNAIVFPCCTPSQISKPVILSKLCENILSLRIWFSRIYLETRILILTKGHLMYQCNNSIRCLQNGK